MHSEDATTCDVVDCDQPAIAPFVHVTQDRVLGFGICASRAGHMEQGRRPTVINDPAQGPGERPALTILTRTPTETDSNT